MISFSIFVFLLQKRREKFTGAFDAIDVTQQSTRVEKGYWGIRMCAWPVDAFTTYLYNWQALSLSNK